MAVERVVVEVHLRVERQQIAARGDDERVDLEHRRVGAPERVVQGVQQLRELPELRALETECEADLPRLERQQPDARVHVLAQDTLGCGGGHLLDVHAASGTGHDDRTSDGAIEQQAHVEFAADLQALLDEHARDDRGLRDRSGA